MTTVEQKVDAVIRLLIANNDTEYQKAMKDLRSMMKHPSAKKEVQVADAETHLRKILVELGAPDHLMGHEIAIQAILMVIEEPQLLNSITFRLYPELAVQFDLTAPRVERGIRNLVEVTWQRADLDVIDKYFGNIVHPNKGKPTNSEFIARLANLVKQRMKNDA